MHGFRLVFIQEDNKQSNARVSLHVCLSREAGARKAFVHWFNCQVKHGSVSATHDTTQDYSVLKDEILSFNYVKLKYRTQSIGN